MSADDLGRVMPPAVLEDEDCHLRAMSLDDWALEQALSRDPDVVRWTYYPSDLTEEGSRQRIRRSLDHTDRGLSRRYVIVDGQGDAVGTCGISELMSDCPHIFYALLPRARNRGTATRATRLLAGWVRTSGYATALIETFVGNSASERVASKAGFVRRDRFQADHRGAAAWLTRWTLPNTD